MTPDEALAKKVIALQVKISNMLTSTGAHPLAATAALSQLILHCSAQMEVDQDNVKNIFTDFVDKCYPKMQQAYEELKKQNSVDVQYEKK